MSPRPGSSAGSGRSPRPAPGNARRLLVQAAWRYRKRPAVGKALAGRHDGQPAEAVAVAWTAQQRLHRTWNRLEQRARRRTITAVAAARELAGFCWAITQTQEPPRA